MSGGVSVADRAKGDVSGVNNFDNSGLCDQDYEAIKLFEIGVDKETHGLMSEAVEFYRKAFKLNEQVDMLYRSKKVPHVIKNLRNERGKNTAVKVDEKKVRAIDVEKLIQSYSNIEPRTFTTEEEKSNDILVIKLANLGSDNHEEVIRNEHVSPLMRLPQEIWIYVLDLLLTNSPEAWFSFSITCKRNAFLGFGSSMLWRRLCDLIYPTQVYFENISYLRNRSLNSADLENEVLPVPQDQMLILPQYDYSWRHMLRTRPFIKFSGCYISVVNYYSEGNKSELSNSWNNPVRTITYYRYLRFYPDGTCLKVLSSLEPSKVVPQLSKYNKNRSIGISDPHDTPQSLQNVKESHRIYHGRWDMNIAGDIHIEIKEGSVPYYDFYYELSIKTLGGIFKHGKLNWVRYYAIRKPIDSTDEDERIGEETIFTLRNEKPFKFSRVRSYSIDN